MDVNVPEVQGPLRRETDLERKLVWSVGFMSFEQRVLFLEEETEKETIDTLEVMTIDRRFCF